MGYHCREVRHFSSRKKTTTGSRKANYSTNREPEDSVPGKYFEA